MSTPPARPEKARTRSNGEGSIYYRPDRDCWVAQLDLGWKDGKRHRPTRYARTKREAVQKLKAMERRAEQGAPPTDSSMKLSEWFTWWLDNVVDPSDRKASTKASYRAETELHLIGDLGHFTLRTIRSTDITEWMAAMARQADLHPQHTPSARTRQYRLTLLRLALKEAVKHGLLAQNPAEGIAGPKVQRDPTKVFALTTAETTALLAVADKHLHRTLWLLLLVTGLRRGEALGLRWQDLDLDNGLLTVAQELIRVPGKGLVFDTPKSETSRRTISLPDVLVDALHDHQRAEQAKHERLGLAFDPAGLVFTTRSGRPIEPSSISRMFRVLCSKACGRDSRLHNLRHTAATILRAHGEADLLEVSRHLGHSDIRVTEGIYGHVLPEAQKRIANNLNTFLTTALPGGDVRAA